MAPLTEEQKARYAAKKRERYASDPEYCERVKEQSRRSGRKRYAEDPDVVAAKACAAKRNRERYHNDPEYQERVKARSRATWRETDLRRKYNLTVEDYDNMYAQQDGMCLICEEAHDKLCVDHDHTTGIVRGLLCGKCNRSLGMLGDDVARIINAAAYLARHALTKVVMS